MDNTTKSILTNAAGAGIGMGLGYGLGSLGSHAFLNSPGMENYISNMSPQEREAFFNTIQGGSRIVGTTLGGVGGLYTAHKLQQAAEQDNKQSTNKEAQMSHKPLTTYLEKNAFSLFHSRKPMHEMDDEELMRRSEELAANKDRRIRRDQMLGGLFGTAIGSGLGGARIMNKEDQFDRQYHSDNKQMRNDHAMAGGYDHSQPFGSEFHRKHERGPAGDAYRAHMENAPTATRQTVGNVEKLLSVGTPAALGGLVVGKASGMISGRNTDKHIKLIKEEQARRAARASSQEKTASSRLFSLYYS